MTCVLQQARRRQGAVFSFVAVFVHFLIPIFVVVDEAFGYVLSKGLGSGWCWIPSSTCIMVCDNLCMRIVQGSQ